MCGISGFVKRCDSEELEFAVNCMVSALMHRGPDHDGIWIDENIGIAIGHCRLAILDLSLAGQQPMHSASGRYVVVFNGEIYNHLNLRKILTANNEQAKEWKGHSDTETLLECIETWGIESTLTSSVGMFAFAVWDRHEKCLILARDRMGEKPLYYGWQGNIFFFASELKAIKAHPLFIPEIDIDSLTLLLKFNYIPAPFSIYKGIRKLMPGTFVRIPFGQGLSQAHAADSECYWSLINVVQSGICKPLRCSEAEMLVQLEQCLINSIAGQQLADVPLGAFLSGGIDSSLVVSLMQARAAKPVKTFTIGFSETGYNEAENAQAIARHLGTEHLELHVSAEQAREAIPLLPILYDEPFADSSQIPTFLICQQARQYVTVALSGDGGDELFGGYNRYCWGPRIWRTIGWMPRQMRQMLASLIRMLSSRQWNRLVQSMGSSNMLLGEKIYKLAAQLDNALDIDDLYLGLVSAWKNPTNVVQGGTEPQTLLARNADWPTLQNPQLRMMCLDTLTYLPDDILVKIDRAAMGVSLETRAPFLDHRVAELAWRLPLAMKIRNGQGKWALRQLLYRYVPQKLVERPKQGFAIPLGLWLRGPLKEWAEALLEKKRLLQEGYFNPALIRRHWQEHLTGKRNWEHSLWSILMFQAWLEAQQRSN